MRRMRLGLLLILPLMSAAMAAQPQFSDGWVILKIYSQFIPEGALENSDIDVEYKSGVVTLHGSVPTQAAKDRAAAVARATDGVRSVKDNLRVARAGGGTGLRDGWVKARVAAQFVTETALDNSDIDIDVGRGAVTLIGTVSSEAARMRAESMAKATDGVKSVRNNLKLSAPGK
jgi:hyperosmotically inducible periplasmic protein